MHFTLLLALVVGLILEFISGDSGETHVVDTWGSGAGISVESDAKNKAMAIVKATGINKLKQMSVPQLFTFVTAVLGVVHGSGFGEDLLKVLPQVVEAGAKSMPWLGMNGAGFKKKKRNREADRYHPS